MTGWLLPRARRVLWFRQVPLAAVVRALSPALVPAAWIWRRLLFRTRFIAVTGSAGKTTAKECLASILSSQASTFRSYRNQNAPQAVILNILRVRPWQRFAVLEVAGASPGMMRRIADLVRPDVAVVLNVLRTHTTEFRDLEQHAAEKARLLNALRPGGVAVINLDDPLVARMAIDSRCLVVTFGAAANANLHAAEVSSAWPDRLTFRLGCGGDSITVKTRLVGAHWISPVLAAVAVAHALGVPLDLAAAALRNFQPFPGRLQPVRLPNGAVILRDDYNSSVDVMNASLRVLADASAVRRMLVMTDVSDFDGNSRRRQKHFAPAIARAADAAVLIGENSAYGRRRLIEAGLKPDSVHSFASLKPAAEFLKTELRDGDLVLLKGRTTDHVARLFFAQLGPVGCWKDYCPKRMLCDICWELETTPEQTRKPVVVEPPEPARAAD